MGPSCHCERPCVLTCPCSIHSCLWRPCWTFGLRQSRTGQLWRQASGRNDQLPASWAALPSSRTNLCQCSALVPQVSTRPRPCMPQGPARAACANRWPMGGIHRSCLACKPTASVPAHTLWPSLGRGRWVPAGSVDTRADRRLHRTGAKIATQAPSQGCWPSDVRHLNLHAHFTSVTASVPDALCMAHFQLFVATRLLKASGGSRWCWMALQQPASTSYQWGRLPGH